MEFDDHRHCVLVVLPDRPEAAGASKARQTMATLPGLPQGDDPEPDALPVEPDDATPIPGLPDEPKGMPGEPPPV